MKDLSTIEEIVLQAVWRLEDNAYGVTIRRFIVDKIQRRLPYGTLYSVLEAMQRKGFVSKRAGDPSPRRGGRSKNYFSITPRGIEALKAALELKNTLWDSFSQKALRESK
jgi:DNA-binding PadR family transcriptional regulator